MLALPAMNRWPLYVERRLAELSDEVGAVWVRRQLLGAGRDAAKEQVLQQTAALLEVFALFCWELDEARCHSGCFSSAIDLSSSPRVLCGFPVPRQPTHLTVGLDVAPAAEGTPGG